MPDLIRDPAIYPDSRSPIGVEDKLRGNDKHRAFIRRSNISIKRVGNGQAAKAMPDQSVLEKADSVYLDAVGAKRIE